MTGKRERKKKLSIRIPIDCDCWLRADRLGDSRGPVVPKVCLADSKGREFRRTGENIRKHLPRVTFSFGYFLGSFPELFLDKIVQHWRPAVRWEQSVWRRERRVLLWAVEISRHRQCRIFNTIVFSRSIKILDSYTTGWGTTNANRFPREPRLSWSITSNHCYVCDRMITA